MLSEVSGPVPRSAVFLPADPPREGRVAFWEPTGPGGREAVGAGSVELRVVTPELRLATVPAQLLPVGAALPLLTRARTAAATPAAAAPATGSSDAGTSATAFWGAAALLALRLVARGLLLPGLSPEGHDAWRIGPLDAEALDEIRELAAAMPPAAHCVPVGPEDTTAPPRLPSPEPLLRAFLDAVADTLPRSPAAPVVAGGPAYAAADPGAAAASPPGTGLRAWADEVAAGHDRGIRISLRVELRGAGRAEEGEEGKEGAEAPAPSLRAVLQLHGLADATLVADARDVWAAAGPTGAAFPPRARLDALRALRRAVKLWPPLTPMLGAAVPDSVDLADEEVAELLGEAAGVLAADGVQLQWPRGLARTLTSRAVATLPDTSTRPGRATAPGSVPPALLGAGSLLSFDWRHSLGDGADDHRPRRTGLGLRRGPGPRGAGGRLDAGPRHPDPGRLRPGGGLAGRGCAGAAPGPCPLDGTRRGTAVAAGPGRPLVAAAPRVGPMAPGGPLGPRPGIGPDVPGPTGPPGHAGTGPTHPGHPGNPTHPTRPPTGPPVAGPPRPGSPANPPPHPVSARCGRRSACRGAGAARRWGRSAHPRRHGPSGG
ncbi:SNF2 helicase-associated domain-containing protein [Streptomyces lavendulae]|uniref:SNF2 helicase-associated domain-containing protein n=1 Tax=Streptomyces lavendulae TaxID=1914 RepID=UPI0037FC13CD